MKDAKIQHILVLMMENRAFDHMLGYLHYPSKTPFEGLEGKEKDFDNPYGNGKSAHPRPAANYAIHPGPQHIHPSVMTQLLQSNPRQYPYQLTNKGFAEDYAAIAPDHPDEVLNCFQPEHLPVLSTLASAFAVCDHWFCSVPGETWPNRNYAHSANSDGEVAIVYRTYTNKTIYEQLSENYRDWAIYYGGFPPQSIVFTNLWQGQNHRWMQRFKPMKALYRAIRTDHLPHYAFIEPDMLGKNSDSQHPGLGGHNDFQAGERLIWRVYDALRQNPHVFQKTLLVITYDEHGGFFDHVAPPQGKDLQVDPPYRDPDNGQVFPFDLLGPRVPTVLVSPWIAAQTVDQTQYDHSSIPATVRKIFQVNAPPLSHRDAQANTFEGIVTLDQPRQDLPNPEEPQVNDVVRKSKKGVPLRESLAWVMSSMLWQQLREEKRTLPDKVEHLMKVIGANQEKDQNSFLEGISRFFDDTKPPLSERAKTLLQDEENALKNLSEAIDDVIDSVPLANILESLERKIGQLLDEAELEDDAQQMAEWVFHLFDNPIVILHSPDGRAIEQPDGDELQRALNQLAETSSDQRTIWLADSEDHWLNLYSNGSAAFFDKSDRILRRDRLDQEQQINLLKDFVEDRLAKVQHFFQSETPHPKSE